MYQDPNLIYDPQSQVQESVFTPKVSLGRVQGTVSDYREARLSVSKNGIQIDGRAVLPQEQQLPIIIISLFISGWVIAALILEYAVRLNRSDFLPWQDVTEIVLQPHKQRACVVYPNPKKPHKSFSLVLALGPSYDEFVSTVQRYLPERVYEGKIKGATSPVVIGFLLFFVAFLIFVFVMIAANPGPRPSP